ncbi:MAG: 50S ribosomal protein L22 [Sedimentisphaerales bacterium]|jgi:large subunit ribosomal protein L22|nr:50S ribosomal protein L22 [Sedimentisphaerales bacterium]
MLSADKLKELCRQRQANVEQLAGQLIGGEFDRKRATAAIKNWQKGLLKPIPRKEDIQRLATALSVEKNDLLVWHSSYRYAPVSARKARLVTQLIEDRSVKDAMDILKFTRKRAAGMVDKVLKSAVADADEQQADVDNLYVSEARVDDAGWRMGTKRFMEKDRGRAHAIRKTACHIHITVSQV